jgi:hypothetical protein
VVSITCCTAALDVPAGAWPKKGCGRCSAKTECVQGSTFGTAWLERTAGTWFIGSSRKSFTVHNDIFSRAFLEGVVKGVVQDVGTAFRYALNQVAIVPNAEIRDNLRMAFLLGDPAWPLPRPETPG